MPRIYRAPMRARDRDLPLPPRPPLRKARGRPHAAGLRDRPQGELRLDPRGGRAYHLGRIAGVWRSDHSAAARAVGIVHVRPAHWLDRPFGHDDVPAAVAATFARGGRNFQRTHDGLAERETARLWEANS